MLKELQLFVNPISLASKIILRIVGLMGAGERP